MPPLSSTISTATRRRFYFKSLINTSRFISTASLPLEYPLSHPIYTVWGSNTSVGKTLVSAGLAASFLSPNSTSPFKFIYLKPVQTGFPSDSDSRFVFRKFSQIFRHRKCNRTVFASDSTVRVSVPAAEVVLGSRWRDESENFAKCQRGFWELGSYEERKLEGESGEEGQVSELICKTMYAWRDPVSPHLAAERENAVVADKDLLEMLEKCLSIGSEEGSRESGEDEVGVFSLIETAGGVASPGPSGSLQCDLYRPFRLPALLVGDGRLGGISSTISAYESLKLRGYDVVAVVLEDQGLVNDVPLLSYLRNRVPVLVLPPIPADMSDNLMAWFDESYSVFGSLKEVMLSSFLERMQRLHNMPKKALEVFWWPFTQHKLVPEDTVTVIDSRCGENFSVHKVKQQDVMIQQFDACASWWTQGPDATLQIELARDMGYTAARFGHVMFPKNVYEPVLKCAELLLEGVGKGWASRAYFSDNGSTAIEIALKMAFRKFLFDHEEHMASRGSDMTGTRVELKVLALKGSYHGDTLGAMEAQSPSAYTGFLQQPWYSGRGYFLDPPLVHICDGTWRLSLPDRLQSYDGEVADMFFGSRDEIFRKSRDDSSLARVYASHISEELQVYSGDNLSAHIGALILEPVIQGAGGMKMIDPLFQRVLVKECQYRKIPVIFDEVFTGFWRLGAESAAELLLCKPDIACFAKLMTGGIIPLAATLATEAVFDAFVGDSKLKALLHGHSYSAHALGCAAASKSINWFKDRQTNHNLNPEGSSLRELWNMELVHQISLHPVVQRVVALGTLCALELRAEGCNAGYASEYASTLLKKLYEDDTLQKARGVWRGTEHRSCICSVNCIAQLLELLSCFTLDAEMNTRYMERTNSMRGKRSLENDDNDDDKDKQQPERKRPALASVIVEALKVDSLQKLCSSLEPILRRVVSEEVERALAKLGPARLNGSGRSSPKRLEGPDGRNLQLHFRSRLSLPLFTGGKVEGEQGATIHMVLLDANTDHVVTFGPESTAKLDIVVLEGDFNNEDDEDWTQEEFESHVVKEREGKRPLLTGDLQVTLKEGVGTLGELTFTDNSSWIRSRKFRLGLKVSSGYCEGIRIREAKTEAFTVKDHRGELYKKHYPPALNDEVWRLEKIGKDGSFHKRLSKSGIFTVEDFLRHVVRDPQKLRTILGSGMSNKMWEALLEHAKTCVVSGKLYVYYPDETRNVGVAFNNIYELTGLITGEQYQQIDSLSDSEKVYVDTLVKKAYENWNQVVEYDGKSLLSFKQLNNASQNELPMRPIEYPNVMGQMAPQRFAVPVPQPSTLDPSLLMPDTGFNDNLATRYTSQAQYENSSSRSQYGSTSFVSQDQQSNNYDNRVGLALGPPQSSSSFQTLNTSVQQSSLNPFDDWSQNQNKGVDDFLSEEEIRVRSHEMLENEDMQHLLRLFSMQDQNRPGKAVVGWLKIKAAMRWGFFIRKKAAERRAKIVQLDDD
ncbi:hypothetical protein POM88_010650 [Heracleum sosnowskyi]|uniref:Uncharacterized protein n=1 Tax=Heracleum sosnowskyi TaxID=360622 RepID=A0AAD8N046_9APIA|nr:hypothetical protein POM88_010650 [Heracleum sosnowskyi]